MRKTQKNTEVLLGKIYKVPQPTHLAVVCVFRHSKTWHVFIAWEEKQFEKARSTKL